MIIRMDKSVEIRKLPSSKVKDLIHILEPEEYWKRLMTIIPKVLRKDSYECDITLTNKAKYNSEHFWLIESTAKKSGRTCTGILFEEWGTSGKVRPALGHLLYLLTNAELFRAADFVAVLLDVPPPPRPSSGPAAPIPVDSVLNSTTSDESHRQNLEVNVGDVSEPSVAVTAALEEIQKYQNEPHTPTNLPTKPPDIVISDAEENLHDHFGVQIVQQRQRERTRVSSVSDMMQFSTLDLENTDDSSVEFSGNVPPITDLLNDNPSAVSESVSDLPAFSQIFSDSKVNFNSEVISHLPDLLAEPSSSNIPNFDAINEESESSEQLDESAHFIPNIEVLRLENAEYNDHKTETPQDSEPNIPNLSIITGDKSVSNIDSAMLPDFSALQNSSKPTYSRPTNTSLTTTKTNSLTFSSQISINMNSRSTTTTNNSAKCLSPLPILNLKTQLPEFEYEVLESATNGFSDEPFTTEENPGRFLGSGAFGMVFLAKGLLDRPVAVKKMLLENVEAVNVDDRVTKQFINEVEVLSKYKHENLLPLLGYSCDGCTYCLMYEYMPGGTLRDRLKVSDEKNILWWTDRFRIAVGTAKAVSYLHTACHLPLIHRDIKSANILLDSSNNAKLSDFGLIKLLPSQNTNTQTTIHGTSAYMSPEAHRGDISVKLDTFSFGVVVLELLTSLAPLDPNRNSRDLVTHVEDTCENDIEPLLDKSVGSWTENNINFSEKLFKISVQCLEEKKKRPNMVEVTQLLEDLLSRFKIMTNTPTEN